MSDCIFCKIAEKEIPAEIAYEDEEVIGFKDLHPEAPIHLLFIPKQHREWTDDFPPVPHVFDNLIAAAKKVAQDKDISQACKLVFNVGKTGHIAHIHLHLLGGWTKDIPMYNV